MEACSKMDNRILELKAEQNRLFNSLPQMENELKLLEQRYEQTKALSDNPSYKAALRKYEETGDASGIQTIVDNENARKVREYEKEQVARDKAELKAEQDNEKLQRLISEYNNTLIEKANVVGSDANAINLRAQYDNKLNYLATQIRAIDPLWEPTKTEETSTQTNVTTETQDTPYLASEIETAIYNMPDEDRTPYLENVLANRTPAGPDDKKKVQDMLSAARARVNAKNKRAENKSKWNALVDKASSEIKKDGKMSALTYNGFVQLGAKDLEVDIVPAKR